MVVQGIKLKQLKYHLPVLDPRTEPMRQWSHALILIHLKPSHGKKRVAYDMYMTLLCLITIVPTPVIKIHHPSNGKIQTSRHPPHISTGMVPPTAKRKANTGNIAIQAGENLRMAQLA